MKDIESLGHELVYKSAQNPGSQAGTIKIRSEVRALGGMQKEALVSDSSTGLQWRLVSDEGPYLNGSDLAPSPLAFYTSGMAMSFTTELQKHAHAAGIKISSYKLTQNNFYTMQGSALRGDMIGGALPAEIELEISSDASDAAINELVAKAEQTSPAQRYMNDVLENRFSLSHNGSTAEVGDMLSVPGELPAEPTPRLAAAQPIQTESFERNIIKKLDEVETVFGVEGGAGSSLQASQKRTLHLRGIVSLREDGLMDCTVQLFKPLGSVFRFIGDDSDSGRAPSSLSYLSAGVGFCFMTQIGRYAHIVKQDLKTYNVVQDTAFEIDSERSVAHPVDTYTYLESGEAGAAMQKNLWMSERTCFLHAAMRGSTTTKISVIHNGN